MTAVAPVVVECGGRWVGWTGDCSLTVDDEIPEASEEDTTPTAGLLKHQVSWIMTIRLLIISIESCGFQVVPVYLNQQQFDSYYNGCCNGTLWPLFHSMSDRAVYSSEYWQVKKVEKFSFQKKDSIRLKISGLHSSESTLC